MNPFRNFETFKQSLKFNKNQYALGVKAEEEQLHTLRQFFNDYSIVPLPEGSTFDFQGTNKLIELKSRRCKRTAFPDTAIGMPKISYAKQCQEDVYYVFKYTDGMYFWKYDKTIQLRLGAISTSGIPHWFIPIKLLSPLILDETSIFET